MSEVKKYGYIDALRGLAIMQVVLVHAAQRFATPDGKAFFLSTKAQYGVQLFFITSALTLFLSFQQRLAKDGGDTVKFFLIRRYFRIAPIYYLAIVFYSAMIVIKPLESFPNYIDPLIVVLSFLFLNSFSPGAINYVPPGGWSVAIEMVFYFMIPFLFSRIKSLKSSIIWFVAVLIITRLMNLGAGYIILHYTSLNYELHKIWFLYFWLPNQLPVFMLGIVLYHLLKRRFTFGPLLGYLIIAGAVGVMLSAFYLLPYYGLQEVIPEFLVVAVLFTVIIFVLSQTSLSLFENRLTRFLGKLSFSMYLSHFIILDGLAFIIRRVVHLSWQWNITILYVVAIAVSAGVSYVLYHKIELTGVRFGQKLIDKLSASEHLKPTPADVVN
ncbi:MAG: acyltransferase [Chitinophagaceae bacterium]